MKQVGILGGGQLGMLLANSIFTLGGRAAVYDPDSQSPLCHHVKTSINGPWLNFESLNQFFEMCDVITYEFENVESAALVSLEHVKPIYPSVKVLRTTQDRVLEKKFLLASGLPHTNFAVADSVAALRRQADLNNYPCIIKTARGGYDGKGQLFARNREDFLSVLDNPDNYWLDTFYGVIEDFVRLEAEVSCIVARPLRGPAVAFPVLENVHVDHILDYTLLPSRIPPSVQKRIKEIAIEATEKLDVYGLLTTEFFLTKTKSLSSLGIECDGWYIYINEFAPRPHNSGHVTRSACCMSQYDALARILLNIPLQEPMIVSAGTFCMMNLLGDVWIAQGASRPDAELDLSTLKDHAQVLDVVIYGKREPRAKRKMGHFVTYGKTPEGALSAAHAFRDSLKARKSIAR
ncbi:MAG: ATP-grasp domain-containing protein [Candidatus Obscuribacterales bacterium]|nr:ATP-grasp domain-containing protein [Candidatus Obscuribacterales bacterium]